MDPILETKRITKNGLVNLLCHSSHMVNPRPASVREDDALYHIFTKKSGQSTGFMCEWLKLFVLMHRKHIARKGSVYLESKGLTIELWADGIFDSRKGDVLVLYTLNLLLEIHTIVHLIDGRMWCTLAQTGPDHTEGQGLYIELIERKIPLKY